MNWRKQGLIYAPSGEKWWAKTLAHIPTAEVVDGSFIRVYFAALDANKFGRVGHVELDIDNPRHILNVAAEPVLDLGEPGTFDDCGTVPSCILNFDGKNYLYYIGFQRAERVPYMLFTGLAVEQQKGSFVKYSKVPILDRTREEPFSRSAPYVMRDEGEFKMWYWSCTEWINRDAEVHYHNVIRYATSSDAIQWVPDEHICIRPTPPDEYSVGRPWVIHSGKLYQMWYSVRSFSNPYFIGYAESEDGIHWLRKDNEAGIYRATEGWDSEMVCYPCVVSVKGQLHMFYNGNGYGNTGFGYAVLES
jgi:predicted GH43/DUF377 family glycosyl hydrolase